MQKDNIRESLIFRLIVGSFDVSEEEAFALSFLRILSDSLPPDSLCLDSGKIKEILSDGFGSSSFEIKSIMKALSSWAGDFMHENIIVPSWIRHILPWDPMPCSIDAADFNFSETASFLELDSRIVPIIRHSISARSPLMLRIEPKLGIEDLYIIRKQLSDLGIPAFILNGQRYESDEDDPISGALYAFHHKGILLVPSSFRGFSEIMGRNIGKRFSLRFGCYMPEDESSDYDFAETSTAAAEREDLQNKGMLVIDTALSYVSGDKLLAAYGNFFGEKNAKTICRLSSEMGVSPDSLLKFKPVLAEILKSKDDESLKMLLMALNDGDQASGNVFLDDERYDISIINADIPIGIIERMALRAASERKPLRLLFTGPSGTGKTAFAHHVAAALGVPLHSKKPGDIFFDHFGETEKILQRIFSDAASERAVLLFDEIDSYVSRKTNTLSAGSKTYNELANCFLQEMEGFSGIMIGTTNYLQFIEPAFLRRFHRIVDFGFPDEEGCRRLFDSYFPGVDVSVEDVREISELRAIGPGDFASLRSLTDFMDPEEVSSSFIIRSLTDTAELRTGTRRNPIGFRSGD